MRKRRHWRKGLAALLGMAASIAIILPTAGVGGIGLLVAGKVLGILAGGVGTIGIIRNVDDRLDDKSEMLRRAWKE